MYVCVGGVGELFEDKVELYKETLYEAIAIG